MSKVEGRRFRGVLPAERRAQRRKQLLSAGLQMFGTRGFHATGIRDICAEAGLTERYFYESFENRERLFAAVFDGCVERLREAMVRAISAHAQRGPVAAGREATRSYLEGLRDDPRLVRVLLIDSLGIDADMGGKSVSATRTFTSLIVPVLANMYPDLAAGGLDFQRVADGLVGSTLFIVTQWALSGFEGDLDDVLDHCMLFYTAIADTLAHRTTS